MSSRLCQQCCQWVYSRDGLCPDCHDLLPDSSDLEALAHRARSLTGTVLRPLGHVSLKRKKLPTEGMLYQTQLGFFFLPHRIVTATKLVEEESTSLLWRIAATLWMPLWFVLPLVKRKRVRSKLVAEAEPIHIDRGKLHLLPDLLPRIPGAFFLAARDVSAVRDRRKWWIFERFAATSLTIEPVNPESFRQHLSELATNDPWRMALEST